MSKRGYSLFLKDILKSSEKILRYSEGKSFEQFVQDELLVDGVIRNLVVIGEAVKNLSEKIKKTYNFIEWKKVAGLRDILIHEYFGVDMEILWDIVQNEIPPLKEQVQKILEEFDKSRED